ncbi:hypothetical protein SO802_012848 [Lithocarpus litseifolius]|uniref:Aminotransferase-like plant mobile domain-containing protein n=1 Tax=Lithocarpus litseifolius TaxID=425828 RepID=A0AAW2D3X7_9ROSI
MASSNGPSFLTFNGKKYHPSLEWNEEEGLLRDPKTHAPYSKKDFNTLFQALLNRDTNEYKDLQLLLTLSKQFWDTTCTFHFPGIGEVMLTPYDFLAITSFRLGGERIKVNDFITLKETKSLLVVMPSKMKSKNVFLIWLYTNIENCKTAATGTRMIMLLFIGTLLCPDLGSTASLCYLWSLRDIGKIKNYDWGGMTYATILHFMTQLSRHSLSSLGGAPFVWQVRF